MGIDIVKCEEGFIIVVKIIKKGVSITNVSVKVWSKTIVKITIEYWKCNSCSTWFKWQKGQIRRFLEFSVLYVYPDTILRLLLETGPP